MYPLLISSKYTECEGGLSDILAALLSLTQLVLACANMPPENMKSGMRSGRMLADKKVRHKHEARAKERIYTTHIPKHGPVVLKFLPFRL